MAEHPIDSILVVDCGTVTTKAMLLDKVAGQYRLLAHGESATTTGYPWFDVTAGIYHAVEQIAEVTGRRFFDMSDNLISPESPGRQGVDGFAATISASQPLQLVLGGLAPDLSLASAKRAAAGTYAQVRAILDGEHGGLNAEERVRAIRDVLPDVVCVVGGTDGGATTPVLELVEAAVLACSMLDPGMRPHLLYAGNAELRQRIVDTTGQEATLHVVDNVRPTLERENLTGAREKLNEIYAQRKMKQLPGAAMVDSWSPAPLTPTAHAFGQLIRYLWHLGDPDKGVLGIDLGAASTTVAAVFDERTYLNINGELGITFGGEKFLQTQSAESITRWLPDPITPDELRAALINKSTHPLSIPQTLSELWLDQALAREIIRASVMASQARWEPGEAQPYPDLLPLCDTIVVSGGVLAHAPRPGQTALIVLDALQPIGVSTLVLDARGLAPALGSIAAVKPLAAVEALDGGGFTNLATVVTPVNPKGNASPGDLALKIQVTYDDGSSFDVEVQHGDLEVLPLPPGKQAVLELHPQRGFDVGLGGPGESGERQVNGGLVGLIIDARGRPLSLPDALEERQEQIQHWLQDMGG